MSVQGRRNWSLSSSCSSLVNSQDSPSIRLSIRLSTTKYWNLKLCRFCRCKFEMTTQTREFSGSLCIMPEVTCEWRHLIPSWGHTWQGLCLAMHKSFTLVSVHRWASSWPCSSSQYTIKQDESALITAAYGAHLWNDEVPWTAGHWLQLLLGNHCTDPPQIAHRVYWSTDKKKLGFLRIIPSYLDSKDDNLGSLLLDYGSHDVTRGPGLVNKLLGCEVAGLSSASIQAQFLLTCHGCNPPLGG